MRIVKSLNWTNVISERMEGQTGRTKALTTAIKPLIYPVLAKFMGTSGIHMSQSCLPRGGEKSKHSKSRL